MKRHWFVMSLAGCALIALGPALAEAEGGSPPGTVSGHGLVQLKRQPDVLRVQVDVLAKGKDLKEALARLKDNRDAVRKQLDTLGAVKSSVEFGEPVTASEKTDRQRQMEMMVKERMRSRGKKAGAPAKQTPAVVVSVSLKAELPLNASSSEELLILANDLQEKVKAADLGRTKDLKQLSAQEEELAEESGEASNAYDDGQPKPGEPIFLFISKISKEEQAKALADAYQKAKREAERLARAAGAELGPLVNLDNTPIGTDFAEESIPDVGSRYYYQIRQRLGQMIDDEQTREAIGFQPGKAVYRVSITASFGIKAPAGK